MERDVLHQVTFRFEHEIELRYLERMPTIGDEVSYEEELWVVDDVSMDTVGPFVICRRSDPDDAGLRVRSGVSRHPEV